MPCTAGGAPVTIETLFGLVKVGMTASAVPSQPSRANPAIVGKNAVGDAALDISRVEPVDANHHGRPLRLPVPPSVQFDLSHHPALLTLHPDDTGPYLI